MYPLGKSDIFENARKKSLLYVSRLLREKDANHDLRWGFVLCKCVDLDQGDRENMYFGFLIALCLPAEISF